MREKIRIAQECARLISREGISDYSRAKRKAASKLGIAPLKFLPSNEEIDAAIAEYQGLFRTAEQPSHLVHLRTLAVEAMSFLKPYSPRLVGSVLSGTADRYSPVTLRIYPQTSEEICLCFINAKIPFSESAHTVVEQGKNQEYPAFNFFVDDTEIILELYPPKRLFQLEKKKTLLQASLEDVLRLIEQT